jgi:hypothetical protein
MYENRDSDSRARNAEAFRERPNLRVRTFGRKSVVEGELTPWAPVKGRRSG